MSYKISFIADIIFLAIIIILSLFLSTFLLQGELVDTQYQDWLVHAYRVRLLDEMGYTSWFHNWSNGISPWQSYQIAPHILTLVVKNVLNISVTKAMIVITIALFAFTRVSLYVVLRLLSFNSSTSFIVVLFSFTIATFWAGAKDFSLLFGYAFFPLMFYLWVLYHKRKISYFFPFLIGLSFYLHPMLGMSIFALWITGNIFSSKALLSKSSLLELLLFLIGSSVFWVPIFATREYTFTNHFFSTQGFIVQVLRDYSFFGISISILLLAALSFVLGSQLKKREWFIPVSVFSILMALLVVIGSLFELPSFLYITQFSRSTGILNLSMLFLAACLVERVFSSKILVIKLVLISVATVSFVQGIEYASKNAPRPVSSISDPIRTLQQQNPNSRLDEGRVWTPMIGSSSYYSDLSTFFSLSYNEHLDSNPIGQRLSQYLLYTNQQKSLTKSTALTINNYMKVTGTKYIFMPSNNLLTESLIKESRSNIAKTTEINDEDASYTLLEFNWDYNNAVFIQENLATQNLLTPSKTSLSKNILALDEIVDKIGSNVDYSAENKLQTRYSSYDQISINLDNKKRSNFILINESYDPNWKAYLDGKRIGIKKFGPNFMLLELGDLNGSTLILKHTWPIYYYVSIYLIGFFIVAIPVFRVGFLMSKKKRKKESKLKLYEIN